jgi:hypothetical protein
MTPPSFHPERGPPPRRPRPLPRPGVDPHLTPEHPQHLERETEWGSNAPRWSP